MRLLFANQPWIKISQSNRVAKNFNPLPPALSSSAHTALTHKNVTNAFHFKYDNNYSCTICPLLAFQLHSMWPKDQGSLPHTHSRTHTRTLAHMHGQQAICQFIDFYQTFVPDTQLY